MDDGDKEGCGCMVFIGLLFMGIIIFGPVCCQKPSYEGSSVGFDPKPVKPGSRSPGKTAEKSGEQPEKKPAEVPKAAPEPEPEAVPDEAVEDRERKPARRKIGEVPDVEIPKREIEMPELW